MLGELILNGADIVLVILLAVFAFVGWKKGFLRMGFGLLSFVLALALGKFLYPYGPALLRQTPMYQNLLRAAEQHTALPETSGKLAEALLANTQKAISVWFAELAVNVIAFLLVVVLVKLLMTMISKTLKLFASLPVIGILNRMSGAILGVAECLLTVMVLLAVIGAVTPLKENPVIEREIEKSVVVREWYLENPLLTWILPNEPKE